MNKSSFTYLAFAILTLLTGCANLSHDNSEAINNNTAPSDLETQIDTEIGTHAKAKEPLTQYRPFPTDTLYSLLVAEVAASRQAFGITSINYVQQAKITNDKAIITRAARITQFFRAHQDSLDMGLLWLAHEPNNIEAITLVANAYLELKQPLTALVYTGQILKKLHEESAEEPLNTPIKDGGAFIETIANLSSNADQDILRTLNTRIESLATQYPSITGIKVGLSVLQQSLGNTKQARAWINKALAEEPDRHSAIIQDALLLQQQQPELAISKLDSKLAKDPSNNKLRLAYARLLTSNNHVEKAYEQFTLLTEQSPRQLDLQLSRAILAIELNKILEAQTIFQQLYAHRYRLNTVNFYFGYIAEIRNNIDDAIAAYMLVNSGESYLPARNRTAHLHIQSGNINAAQTLYQNLRQQRPNDRESLYLAESNLLIQSKADSAALALLNDALKHHPNNNYLRYNRATIYGRQNKFTAMEQDFRHILEKEPNNIATLNGLGYSLTVHTERYEEAYHLIQRAYTLQPNDPAIIDSMGWIEFKRGRIDESLALLKKAYALFPDPEITAHLIEVLWVAGQKENAKTILSETLSNNPDAPEIIDLLKRLNITL